jgi:hypothetical protein
MKIGTFVIGGLAGAAVVMMIQRNQMLSTVAAGIGQSVKRRMSDMKEDAIEKTLHMKFAKSFNRSAENSQSSNKSSLTNESSLADVEKLAFQDPHVSKEINEILEQNGQH